MSFVSDTFGCGNLGNANEYGVGQSEMNKYGQKKEKVSRPSWVLGECRAWFVCIFLTSCCFCHWLWPKLCGLLQHRILEALLMLTFSDPKRRGHRQLSRLCHVLLLRRALLRSVRRFQGRQGFHWSPLQIHFFLFLFLFLSFCLRSLHFFFLHFFPWDFWWALNCRTEAEAITRLWDFFSLFIHNFKWRQGPRSLLGDISVL